MKKACVQILVLFFTLNTGYILAQSAGPTFKTQLVLTDDIPSNPYQVTLTAVRDSGLYYTYNQKSKEQEFSFTIKSKIDTIYTKSFSPDLKRGNILLEGPYYFKKNGIITEQGSFYRNAPTGVWLYFTPNAVLYKKIIYNIDESGTELHQFFNPDLNLQRSAQIRNNRLVGTEELYYPNERLQTVLHYQDGMLNGEIETYDTNGATLQKYVAVNGIITEPGASHKDDTIDLVKINTDTRQLLDELVLPNDLSHLIIYNDAKLKMLIDEKNTIQKVWLQNMENVKKSLESAIISHLTGKVLNIDKDLLGFPIPIVLEVDLSHYLRAKYYVDNENVDEMIKINLFSNFDWSYIDEEGWIRIMQFELEEKALTVVDEMPQFPGGADALAKFLNKNLQYPRIAQEHGVMGRVYVSFVVAKDGKLKDIRVLRSADPGLDKEAIRVVKAMPNWVPGKVNGQPVNVKFALPINFVLKNKR